MNADSQRPDATEQGPEPAWSALVLLIGVGVPVVATGPSTAHDPPARDRPTPTEMADAALTVIGSGALAPWVLEAVGAFLLAWAHEWPRCFHASFGPRAREVGAWAREHTPDPGRYLKLRRMAIANLASVL